MPAVVAAGPAELEVFVSDVDPQATASSAPLARTAAASTTDPRRWDSGEGMEARVMARDTTDTR